MRKVVRIAGISLLVLLVIAQFRRPAKNFTEDSQASLFKQTAVPAEVSEILKNACLDCHSNQTQYHWYHEVAPVSWLVAAHIEDGKKELNFSEWGDKSAIDQINLLTKIIDEVKAGKMPLESYSIIHAKARLSDNQKKVLNDWAETYGMELFQKK